MKVLLSALVISIAIGCAKEEISSDYTPTLKVPKIQEIQRDHDCYDDIARVVFIYDSAGELIRIWDEDNQISTYVIFQDDLLVEMYRGGGYRMLLKYNEQNQIAEIQDIYPSNQGTSTKYKYSYNSSHQVIERTKSTWKGELLNRETYEWLESNGIRVEQFEDNDELIRTRIYNYVDGINALSYDFRNIKDPITWIEGNVVAEEIFNHAENVSPSYRFVETRFEFNELNQPVKRNDDYGHTKEYIY